MDKNGTIILAKHKDIYIGSTTLSAADEVTDVERLPWEFEHLLTTCDFYPESLEHSLDDKSVVVCGDGKYIIINNSLPWKVASSGSALEFVWSSKGGYAVKGDSSHIEIFNKNFEVRDSFFFFFFPTAYVNYICVQKKGIVTPPYSVEGIFCGTFLAMSSSDFIDYYDWEKCVVISRVDVTVKVVKIPEV
ncbi:PREDICTED: coatomer subunit beta'-1-like [Camelina sativa]|uniref:Coatomer subunit beta'-1-like n=1 Tax=Camelina sativa TaxID=90675 RepID=A0ABM1Q906_CAMSA|nr:PREDICTED: coatomer subunit beta'-1-like [Camelina sativa]